MIIGILGFNLTKKDIEQINKVLTGCKITSDYQIIDVRSVDLTIAMKDLEIVLALGRFASNMGRKKASDNGSTFIELPDIKKLYPIEEGGDKEARTSAYNTLVDLQSTIDSGKLRVVDDRKAVESIKEDEVPDLSPGQIQKLKDVLQETGKTDWVCLTKSGQSVRVSLTPSVDSNFDINMTFDELLAIRVAMDILQAQEVQFVSSSNKGSKGSSK